MLLLLLKEHNADQVRSTANDSGFVSFTEDKTPFDLMVQGAEFYIIRRDDVASLLSTRFPRYTAHMICTRPQGPHNRVPDFRDHRLSGVSAIVVCAVTIVRL